MSKRTIFGWGVIAGLWLSVPVALTADWWAGRIERWQEHLERERKKAAKMLQERETTT